MKKFLFTIPISFIFGILAFHFSISDSFALATSSSEMIWGAWSIASEYYINHAGKTITGVEYGLNDINDPFTASSSFGSAYAQSQGISLQGSSSASLGAEVIENGRVTTVDVSTMPTTAYASMMSKLVPDYDGSDSYYVEALKLGGITLVYAVEKNTHELVASGWDNIMAKFDTLTQSDLDSINNTLTSNGSNSSFVHSTNISTSQTWSNGVSSFYFAVDSSRADVFYYSENGYVKMVYQTNLGAPNMSFGSYHGINHSTNTTSSYSAVSYSASDYTFTLNGISYSYGSITCTTSSASTFTIRTSTNFGSLDAIKTYLSQYGTVYHPINTELVDSQGLLYEVPSLRDTATTIGDIYPALQGIREGILTVPAVGSLATSIPAQKEDSIAQAIADAIAIGISLPDVKEDDEPAPDDTVPDDPIELPDWIVPSFFPDLLPIDMFTIFQPVMDIVGSSYSVYGLWIGLPAVLIFILILYIIVSVL